MKLYYSENNLITEEQFNNHLQLYEGYINKVNDINQRTSDKLIDSINLASTRRDMQYALNGIILHELYFENIKVRDNTQENECLITQIIDFDDWRQEFKTLALNSRGWVLLIHEQRTGEFLNISLTSHDEGLVCCCKPIIVLDMYEHAYYTDYANDKNRYIDRFIENIDWQIARERVNQI